MCGIKSFLGFVLLLSTANARPDGYYGVKGGRPHGALASAAASAHVSANAGSEGSAIAQSSASAGAFAGFSSSAAASATANAFADGEHIGKAISSAAATGNANPIGGSSDLGSSGHEKGTEYKAANSEDGTPSWYRPIANAGHGGLGNNENSAPGTIGVTNGASLCQSGDLKCGTLKSGPSVSNPRPTYNKHPDLSAGSSQPLPNLNGGWGGNVANQGSHPCTSGSSKCSGSQPGASNPDQSHEEDVHEPIGSGRPVNRPSVSNPYPTYNKNPNLPSGSSQPLPNVNGGWGGSSGSHPCTSGSPKCSASQPGASNPDQSHEEDVYEPVGSGRPVNRPSVSNPYPTYNKNPNLQSGSSQPLPNVNGGWGGNPGSRPCTSGSPKCSASQPGASNPDQSHEEDVYQPVGKPSVSNPHPTYDKNPDLSGGSSQPLPNVNSGWGGSSGSHPCTSGSPKCSGSQPGTSNPDESHQEHTEGPSNKPSVSNPHPTYNQHPDLSAGSSQPLPNPNGGSGGNVANSGSHPCTSGSSKCSEGQPGPSNPDQSHQEHVDEPVVSGRPVNKPSISNPYPTYNKNPNLPSGSSQPLPNLNGGWGGNPASRPCTSGGSKCLGSYPGASNPDEPHQEHVAVPAISGRPINKPSVSNPHPTYNKNPDLSGGSSQPMPNLDGGWGGNTANPGSRPCASGTSKCSGRQPSASHPNQSHEKHVEVSANRPSVSNPYPTYNKHPDLSAGSSQPLPNSNGGWGGNGANPGSRPCTSGSAKCSGSQPGTPNPDQFHQQHIDVPADSASPINKPSVLNPYPTYNKHPDLSVGSSQPSDLTGGYGDGKSIKTPGVHGVEVGHQSKNPIFPTSQPKHHENSKPTHDKNPAFPTGPSQPGLGGCKAGSADSRSQPCNSGSYGDNSDTSNPFLNGKIDVSDIQKAVKSSESGSGPSGKPNPSNPFLNPHSQYPSTSPSGTPYLTHAGGNNQPGGSTQYPDNKVNPSNPFLNPHSQHPKSPTGTQQSKNPSGNKEPSGASSQFPNDKVNPSNPFFNSHSQHPSTSSVNTHNSKTPNFSNGAKSPGQYPHSQGNPSSPFPPHHGHGGAKATAPTSHKHKGSDDDNDGDYSADDDHAVDDDYSDDDHSVDDDYSDTDHFGNKKTSGTPSSGVKTHRAGVKGGSAHRPQSSRLTKHDESDDGSKGSVDGDASWDALSKAHAVASSSADGKSSGNARSQAYSNASASSWSSSWASSSASASASSYSNSSH